MTEAEVLLLIRALPDKQCMSDPLPTWLLKGCAELLAPVLRDIINQSLETGTVPTSFKTAYITPLLKKTRSGSGRREIVSIDFEPVDHIQAA